MHGKSFRIFGLILAILLVGYVVVPAYASPALQGGGNGAAGVNNWQTILPGQTQEWILEYTGNNDNANVELGMNPSNSVGFNVFTDQQWKNGDTSTPVGSGTQRTTLNTDTGQNEIANNGDLFWATSSSGGPQRYHIQVYSRSQQPAQYWINATGPGVGSLTAYNANISNSGLQGQSTQGTGTNTSGTNTQGTATNTSGTGANSQAPRTLPTTGGSDLGVLFAAAVAALLAGGWLVRRQAN